MEALELFDSACSGDEAIVNPPSVRDLKDLSSRARADETSKEVEEPSLFLGHRGDPSEVPVPSTRFQTLKLHSCRGSIIGFSFCPPNALVPVCRNFGAARGDCKSDSPL